MTNIENKAEKFIREGCVKYIGKGLWHITPLLGRTKQHHEVVKINDPIFEFHCDCQGYGLNVARWHRGERNSVWCSHIIAVVRYEAGKKAQARDGEDQLKLQFK